MRFSNKVVIITGASSGIGAATAILFAKEGANVVMIGRNEAKLETVSEQCAAAGHKPLIIKADVGNEDEVKRIVKETVEKFGKIDILVNNAGISQTGCMLDGKAIEAYDEIMRVNVRAVICLTSEAVPYLAKTKGNIINISSVVGQALARNRNRLMYYISKAALNHFTKGIALELSSSGIRVNAISPGPVFTDFFDNNEYPISWEAAKGTTALKRVSEADEIANIIAYLSSDIAKGITGSIFVVDNGYLLQNA